MNDQDFIDRIQEKIERLTEREIELRIDEDDGGQLGVDFGRDVPLVIMGRKIFEYSGFARLCTEYAVASIREGGRFRRSSSRCCFPELSLITRGSRTRMAAEPKQDLSEYPRPWFYRPEIYYGFIIFPPVWSILTLRSPWHSGEGFRGIVVGGLAWFFIIASVVLSVRWVQEAASSIYLYSCRGYCSRC